MKRISWMSFVRLHTFSKAAEFDELLKRGFRHYNAQCCCGENHAVKTHAEKRGFVKVLPQKVRGPFLPTKAQHVHLCGYAQSFAFAIHPATDSLSIINTACESSVLSFRRRAI